MDRRQPPPDTAGFTETPGYFRIAPDETSLPLPIDPARILLRLPPGASDEMLEESLDDMAGLILIEWAEYLPARVFPADRVEMYWRGAGDKREVSLSGNGAGRQLLARLAKC